MLKWQEVLEEAQYQNLTSSYIAREKNITIQHASVVLRRLWKWGLLRRKRDKDMNCPGQPRYYYEITNKGWKYLSWHHEQPAQKRRTRREIVIDEINEIFIKQGIPKIELTEKVELHNDKDAYHRKRGVPKIEKTEEEEFLDGLKAILDEAKKKNREATPTGVDKYLYLQFFREYIIFLKQKGLLSVK